MSGLDFLEIVILLIFFGAIALITYGVWAVVHRFFQGNANSGWRAASVVLGLGLAFYVAGWVIFKDLGSTYMKMAMAPWLAPKVRVVAPEHHTGYVTVLFGDALGEMKREKGASFYSVKVDQDGRAIVPCPPRLEFFWDQMAGVTIVTENDPSETTLREVLPSDWSYGRGGIVHNGLKGFYISFYVDTPKRLEELNSSVEQRPAKPFKQESDMVEAYEARFGVKSPGKNSTEP